MAVWRSRARAAERREIAARADRHRAVVGLQQVAVAGEQEALLLAGDQEHRLQLAQHPVGPPILGQLDHRLLEVALELVELGLEAGVERQAVGRAAGEADQGVAAADPLHLRRLGFHDGVAEGDLAIAGHHHFRAAPHQEHGGGVHRPALPGRFVRGHDFLIGRERDLSSLPRGRRALRRAGYQGGRTNS